MKIADNALWMRVCRPAAVLLLHVHCQVCLCILLSPTWKYTLVHESEVGLDRGAEPS